MLSLRGAGFDHKHLEFTSLGGKVPSSMHIEFRKRPVRRLYNMVKSRCGGVAEHYVALTRIDYGETLTSPLSRFPSLPRAKFGSALCGSLTLFKCANWHSRKSSGPVIDAAMRWGLANQYRIRGRPSVSRCSSGHCHCEKTLGHEKVCPYRLNILAFRSVTAKSPEANPCTSARLRSRRRCSTPTITAWPCG